MKYRVKSIFRRIIMMLLAIALLLMGNNTSYAKWEIEYSDQLVNAMRRQGHSIQKQVGSYANRAECEEARQRAGTQSGDPLLAMHMQCIGFDDPSSQAQPLPLPPSSAGTAEEELKQKVFDQEKAGLLKSLKGVHSKDSGAATYSDGTGKLKLKRNSNPPASGTIPAHTIDVQKINRRIADLQRNIVGIQNLLQSYSKTLHGNRTEFEKWEATVQEAYDDVLDNSKEYVLQMFLKYNLLGSLERSLQKSVFGQLGNYFSNSDPAARKWLMEQTRPDQIKLSRLKKVVEVGNLSGDFATLLKGGHEETRRNMDALLFVNSLLETKEIVKYEKMLKNSKSFNELPGEYFSQAKMIGETYANLSAIVYSWYSIKKLTYAVESYGRAINSLGHRMRLAMKETDCLKRCLEFPEEQCMDRCAGKTRLSTPPPLPR